MTWDCWDSLGDAAASLPPPVRPLCVALRAYLSSALVQSVGTVCQALGGCAQGVQWVTQLVASIAQGVGLGCSVSLSSSSQSSLRGNGGVDAVHTVRARQGR